MVAAAMSDEISFVIVFLFVRCVILLEVGWLI
jgi:hypothetical protein